MWYSVNRATKYDGTNDLLNAKCNTNEATSAITVEWEQNVGITQIIETMMMMVAVGSGKGRKNYGWLFTCNNAKSDLLSFPIFE